MLRNSSIKLLAVVSVFLGAVSAAIADEPLDYSGTFLIDPLTVMDKVAAIQPRAAQQKLGKEELRMLQDFRSGNLKGWSSTDVALIVAGITSENEVKHYKAQLNQITAQARRAVADATTPEQKVTKLAKFLHDVPMKAGYVSGQYDLKVLLDTGHYNCVSSAVFFDMIARRLGLKVEAVNIPHHVFCRLAELDIEPTSGRVYPASIRGDRVLKKRKDDDDKQGSLWADQLFRETSNRGLMSEPYFDEGCKFEKEMYFDKALVSFLKAATLEPKSPDIARGVNNSIKAWFSDSLAHHQFSRAAAIARLYREMLRDSKYADVVDKALMSAGRKQAA